MPTSSGSLTFREGRGCAPDWSHGGPGVATPGYRRVTETTGCASPKDFHYNTGGQLLEEDTGATVNATYLWGGGYIDALICRGNSADGNYYALYDANFNVTGLEMNGTMQERFAYSAYGTRGVLNASWNGTTDTKNWVVGWQGLRWDAAIGMYYARNRWFSPTLMRWGSWDPMGYPDGLNTYLAMAANPINRVDPSGLHIYVYPSGQVADAGTVVAGAIQKFAGAHATIYAQPHYKTVNTSDSLVVNGVVMSYAKTAQILDYWEILYRNENTGIHDCADDPWARIKKAIDMWNNIHVYLRDKNYLGEPMEEGSTYPGGGGLAPRHPTVSINYKDLVADPPLIDGEPGTPNLVQKPSSIPGRPPRGPFDKVKDPWEVVLYHELFGHAYMYVYNISGWNATHNDSVPYDPVIQVENIGRRAYEYNTGEILGERHHRH